MSGGTSDETFRGRAFHATSVEHAPLAACDFDGYLKAAFEKNLAEGGRFNPCDEFGAIYFSLDPVTPLRESPARLLLTVEVRLMRVVGLHGPDACRAWDLAPDALTSGDHAPCQAAARAIRDRYEAIRYPSAVAHGENLVVFWDRRDSTSLLRLVGSREVTQR